MNTDIPLNKIVAKFASHETAQQAIRQLSQSKFDMSNLTIVGRDYHTEEQPVGYINTGDRMVAWGKLGAFWGSLWGILFGSAVIFIPGIGPVVFAGWLVTALVGALEGAVLGGGAGVLGAALTSIGLKKDSVVAYEDAIKAGNFLVVVRGTPIDIALARTILVPLGATDIEEIEHRTPVAV